MTLNTDKEMLVFVYVDQNKPGNGPNRIQLKPKDGTTSTDYDYWIKFYKKGSSDVWKKFENKTVSVSASEVKGYTFCIVLAEKGDASHVEKKWFASNNGSNKNVNSTGSTNFDLTESDPQNIDMPSLESGNFTFNLTVGSNKMPTNLSVTAPGGTTSDRKLYIYGNVKQAGVYSDKTDGILLTKNADGKYEGTVTFYKSKDDNNSYFRFWDEDNQKIWSYGSDNGTPSFSSANANADITNYNDMGNWYVASGSTYTIILDENCQSFTISSGGDIPDTDYEYFISHKNPSSSSWTNSDSYKIEANGSKKFTVNLNYNDRFVIKSGGNTYGPLTERGVNNNDSYSDTFGTASFVWVGDSGNVDITVTLGADGKPKSVSFAQESVTPGPGDATLHMMLGYRDDNWHIDNWEDIPMTCENGIYTYGFNRTNNTECLVYFALKDNSDNVTYSYGSPVKSYNSNHLFNDGRPEIGKVNNESISRTSGAPNFYYVNVNGNVNQRSTNDVAFKLGTTGELFVKVDLSDPANAKLTISEPATNSISLVVGDKIMETKSIKGGGTLKFETLLKKENSVVFRSASKVFGPAGESDVMVEGAAQYTDISATDGSKFIWNAATGKAEISVTVDKDGNVTAVSFKQLPTELYYYTMTNGAWTEGKLIEKGGKFEVEHSSPIFVIFGMDPVKDKDNGRNLYGVASNSLVESSSTARAQFGMNSGYYLASGKWTITVTDYVAAEYVDFEAVRNGDAAIPADGYTYYSLKEEGGSETGNLKLEWDGSLGFYTAVLPSGNKGKKYKVYAAKEGKYTDKTGDYFGWGSNNSDHVEIVGTTNTVDIYKNDNAIWLECNNEHLVIVKVENGRYSKPISLSFRETLDPQKAGKIYLISQYLNDNTESPAWEMKPQPDGTYFLDEFAMRKCDYKNKAGEYCMQIVQYDESGRRLVADVLRDGFFVPRDFDRQPGRLCTATLNAEMTVITINEKLRDDGASSSILPYIGILGKNFRQHDKYNTRHTFYVDNDPTKEQRMGNTHLGWQEAYIEYGQSGHPLFDVNGLPYYNTVWPPRYNIPMESYIGDDVDPLNVTSDDLTMRRDKRGVMTGADWVTALQKDNKYEYATTEGDVTTNADNEGLRLDPDRKYARYYVENVWLMGEYKIWTGWGGEKNASWGADWNKCIYFGPNNGNQQKSVHKTYVIGGEESNFFTAKSEDDNYAREFYRTMEIFLPVNDSETDYDFGSNNANPPTYSISPRFYLTEADGGAKIDAIARGAVGSQAVGYAPSLSNMPGGFHVSEYKVTRYAYDANTDREEFKPCDIKRKAVEKTAAVVKSGTGLEIKDYEEFNALFTKDFGTDAKYTKDGEAGDYGVGRYIFRLEATFVNEAGETRTADVWSPFIEIYDKQGEVHIYHAQLVELPADNPLCQEKGYKYITYSKERTRFHRVAVKVVDNDRPVELTRQEDLEPEEVAKLRDVYLKDGVWTNKTLLLTEDPSRFTGEMKVFKMSKVERDEAGNETNVDTQLIDLMDERDNKIRNWYAYIYDGTNQIAHPESFKVDFTGELKNVEPDAADGSTIVTDLDKVEHKPQFPLPYIDTPKARVEVKLTENTDEWPALYTASHEHLNIVEGTVNGENSYEDTNPFQQWREDKVLNRLEVRVPVQLPNISMADGLRDAAYGKLTVKVNDKELGVDKENLAAGRAYIVYDHQSPYDWLTYDSEWKVKDATSWNTTGSEFATENCAIEGISEPGIHDKTAVLATFAPSFDTPSLSLEDGTLGFRGEWSGPENGIYTYTGYLTVFNPTSHPIDALVGNNDLVPEENGSYTPQYLFHVESTGDVDGVSDVETVSQVISEAGGKYKLVSAKVRADKLENMSDFMRTLKLSFSRAYYFYSGDEKIEAGQGHRNCGSTLVGLTGEFPFHIGGDIHTAAPSAAPVQKTEGQPNGEAAVNLEPSTTGHSSTLYAGDNAFLFAPKYKTFDFSLLSDIQVGIDGIMDSDVRVVTGKGFIDLLGNEGRIYSTDGRLVYSGASRAEVISGVYVVVLDGKTVKVFVK